MIGQEAGRPNTKMLIVDDVFMSVGSANKNNRGLVYAPDRNRSGLDILELTGETKCIGLGSDCRHDEGGLQSCKRQS